MGTAVHLGNAKPQSSMTYIDAGTTGSGVNRYSDIFDTRGLPFEVFVGVGARFATSSTNLMIRMTIQTTNDPDGTWKDLFNASMTEDTTDGPHPQYYGVRTRNDTTANYAYYSDNGNTIGQLKTDYLNKRRASVTLNGTTYTRSLVDASNFANGTGRYVRFRYYANSSTTSLTDVGYGFGAVTISPLAEVILTPTISSVDEIVIPMRQK